MPTLVKILEHAISAHFVAMETPKTMPDQVMLPRDALGYGWHGVTSHLSLLETTMEEVCRTALSECAGLVLHAHLLQTLPNCSSLEEEYRVAVKTVQWSTQLKPKSVCNNSVTYCPKDVISTEVTAPIMSILERLLSHWCPFYRGYIKSSRCSSLCQSIY